jgi:hypothetical protein
MRARSRRFYAVAMALVAIQIGLPALGSIGMCVDRPHTYNGLPAPDCLMHASLPAGAVAEASHHEHNGSMPDDGARLVCSCSSDAITLLTTETAVAPRGLSVPGPNLAFRPSPGQAKQAPDVRLTPLSPPPEPALS